MEVLALEVLEGVEVAGRGVAGLGAGDVEPGHAAVAPLHGQLGDLHRPGGVPHGGQQLAHHDAPVGGRHALVEAALHRFDDLVEGQALLEVLLGGVADLGVDHAVGHQVLDALACHPGQRVGGLHHRDGVGEGLQVALQRARVGRLGEPATQRGGVAVGVGGQLVPDLARELEHRGRPQPAVEVVVQEHLRRPQHVVAGQGGRLRDGVDHGAILPPETRPPGTTSRSRRCARSPRSTRSRPRPARSSAPPRGSRSPRSASTPSPTPPVTTSGSTSTPSAAPRAPSVAPSPTATSRSRWSPGWAARSSRSTPPAPSSTTASTRSASRTPCASASACAPTSRWAR